MSSSSSWSPSVTSSVSWMPSSEPSTGIVTNSTSAVWNITTSPGVCPADKPEWIGYVAVIITSFVFGSNLLPVKQFETGDGMFFQFIQCCTIAVYGIFFNWIIGSPQFEPLAMLGGAMWATGNMFCVLVIRSIGLGVGLVLWSLQGMLLGWASGRFGWFGPASVPAIEWLQYLGVALGAIRGIVSMFIKAETVSNPISDRTVLLEDDGVNTESQNNEVMQRTNSGNLAVNLDNVQTSNYNVNSPAADSQVSAHAVHGDFLTRLSPGKRQLFGISLALFAGTLFGFQFAPVTIVKQSAAACTADWDFAFAFYCGSLAASMIYMLIYSLIMRNRPYINPQLFAPAVASGFMWVIGQTGWFVANETLSQAVSYPVINTGPALVALFWAVVVFHEIQGKKNLILLGIATALGLVSVALVAASMDSNL